MASTADLKRKLALLESKLEETEDADFVDSLVRTTENTIRENREVIRLAEQKISDAEKILADHRKIAKITISVVRKEQNIPQQKRTSGFKKGRQRGSGSAPYANTFLRQRDNRNVKVAADGTWLVTPVTE